MLFSDIPDRSNLAEIMREWFDNLRDAGIALESLVGGGYLSSSAAIADNTTGGTVTGLVFSSASVRAARIKGLVFRKTTEGEVAEIVVLDAIYVNSAWEISEVSSSGSDAGVEFLIDDTTGQVTYNSSDMSGTYDTSASKFYFKAETWDV